MEDHQSDAVQVSESACDHCGAKFTPKRRWQRFCTGCRFADWNERNLRQRIVTERLRRIEAKLGVLLKFSQAVWHGTALVSARAIRMELGVRKIGFVMKHSKTRTLGNASWVFRRDPQFHTFADPLLLKSDDATKGRVPKILKAFRYSPPWRREEERRHSSCITKRMLLKPTLHAGQQTIRYHDTVCSCRCPSSQSSHSPCIRSS
jgi:hypothetical protein